MSPRHRLLFVAALLAGFGLRVADLDGFSLWLDELIQLRLAQAAWGDFPAALTYGAHMPADFVLTRLALGWGSQEFWLRLPAAFIGVISVALIVAVARRLAPPPIPALSALLLAFAPLAVQYSRELRPYSLFLALVLLSTWLYLAAAKRPEAWMGYAPAMLALLHTHLFGLTLLPVHGLHWLVTGLAAARRQRRWQALAPGVSAFAVILAIFLLSPFRPDYLFRFGQALAQGLTGPSAAASLQIAPVASAFPTLAELAAELPTGLTGAWPWGLPVLLTAIVGVIIRRRRPADLALILLWLLLPPVLILYSLAQRDQFFSPRYLIGSLPPLLILTAAGLTGLAAAFGRATALPQPIRRALPSLAVCLLIATFTPGLRLARHPDYEDWRAAAAYLRPRLTATSAVVIPAAAAYVRHYLPETRLIDADTLDQVAVAAGDAADIYLLQSLYSRFPIANYPSLAAGALEQHFAPSLDLYHFPASALAQTSAPADLELLPAQLTTPRPADHIDELRQFARQARANTDWPAAIAALQVLIPLQSGDGNLWAELGFAYQQTGRPQDAIRAYRNSLTIDDDNPWAHLLLAGLLRQSEQAAEAIVHGRRAVELAPDLPEAWAALAFALHADKKSVEALAAFDRALKLRPNNLDLRLGRAHAAEAARSPLAEEAWRAVLDLAPPPDITATACKNLANAHPACK